MTIPAGYNSAIKMSGASTASTGEACANIDSGAYLAYQVTDAAKRILWLADGLTVYVDSGSGAVEQDPSTYTVDALFGTITFGSALGSGDTVTADINYLPTATVGAAKSFTREVTFKDLDVSANRDNSGRTRRIPGIGDADIQLDLVEPVTEIFDGDAATIESLNGTIFVIEIQPDVNVDLVWRCIILANSTATKSAVDQIAAGSFHAKAAAQSFADFAPQCWGWGTAT